MDKEQFLVIKEKSKDFDLLWRFLIGDWDCILKIKSFTLKIFCRSMAICLGVFLVILIVFLITYFICALCSCYFNKEINCEWLFSFFKNDYKWFLGSFGVIFAYLRKIHSDKWKYCADLYNKINELEISNKRDGANTNLMRNTLAIDILDLKIWSNKSFNDFLVSEIKREEEYFDRMKGKEKESYPKKYLLNRLCKNIESNKPVCLSKVRELLYIRHGRLAD